ncbi:hypothetical protein OS493_036759 [Desmophyllum pertusum]|uniref:Death domain-containing protein n=1 Tax=Desmophyllum pertusum TaxID=174260 RepID=A0A9W9YX97_9CNID|nr:hypothetical protein OS493_036759 [Desmophyllum pertusum]
MSHLNLPVRTGECFWHGDKRCCHDDCAHYVSVTQRNYSVARVQKAPTIVRPRLGVRLRSALEDASRHNQDEVPDKEQTSTLGFKRQQPNQDTQATVPAKVARTAVKDGIPEGNRELHQLANDVSAFWRALGRELKVEEPKLVQIDRDNQQDTYEKAYQMLMHWRNDNADAATYLILFNALTVLGHSNLAKQYCTV